MLERLKRAIFGAPKDIKDPHAFHQLSLIALLAWVGLGADGLSSSAYGPEEAFKALGEHRGLAILLALATSLTVFIISYAYSRVIEHFPSGGGGYVVATKLLGKNWGVLSGCALLVDYVLTITVSIASGADAIFSLLPPDLAHYKIEVEILALVVLTIMNIRGVKESVTALLPIFMIFVITHAILLVSILGHNLTEIPAVSREVSTSIHSTIAGLGIFGTLKLFVRAYSLGGGTYTGIEAVSNGVSHHARAARADGQAHHGDDGALPGHHRGRHPPLLPAAPGRPRSRGAQDHERAHVRVVRRRVDAGRPPVGHVFVWVALLSEGALLFVAAQTGFVDGPRVMANMAIDSWLPHRFSALSERLSMRNGVVLMGGASIGALLYTSGDLFPAYPAATGADVSKLVVMYSINVFLTFSLSEFGMSQVLDPAPQGARQGVEAPPPGPPHRPHALPHHPRGHRRREVRRGGLAHAGDHRPALRRLPAHQAPLQRRGPRHPGPRRGVPRPRGRRGLGGGRARAPAGALPLDGPRQG